MTIDYHTLHSQWSVYGHSGVSALYHNDNTTSLYLIHFTSNKSLLKSLSTVLSYSNNCIQNNQSI